MIDEADLNSKENREDFNRLLEKAGQAGKSLEEYVQDLPLSKKKKRQ